jgi:SIR2-like protein
MHEALRSFFEEQIKFRLQNGTPLEGSVFIGETEFLPVETLQEDEDGYQSEFNAWLGEVWVPEQEDRRNQILKLHANAKRYADLCDAVARRQVVPLVGSGMSAPSGLPTWSDLLRKIRAFTKIDPMMLEDLLVASAFEEAADLIASATNPNLLNERVEHELRVDDPVVIDGAVRLLPATFPDLVITTNLDDVLEQHYRRCGVEFNEVLPGKDISRYRGMKTPAQRFLLKLHGDCRRAETRVLRRGEYEAAYAPGSVVREELALLYRTNHLLFLGCSLGPDRTVRLIAEVATSDKSMPKHFALLPLPGSDPARVERENFLSERGIYPIWYDGPHDESICALLAGMLDVAGAGQAGLG